MKNKILTIFFTFLLIFVSFPQTVWAEYYNRDGELLQPTTKVIGQDSIPKKPPQYLINLKDRKYSTKSYEYIIENKCKTLAVNLYRGETLYHCSNGVEFWSDVSIEPFIMIKNQKKHNDEILDDVAMSSAISSNVIIMQ